jgi:hypothetical protein
MNTFNVDKVLNALNGHRLTRAGIVFDTGLSYQEVDAVLQSRSEILAFRDEITDVVFYVFEFKPTHRVHFQYQGYNTLHSLHVMLMPDGSVRTKNEFNLIDEYFAAVGNLFTYTNGVWGARNDDIQVQITHVEALPQDYLYNSDEDEGIDLA